MIIIINFVTLFPRTEAGRYIWFSSYEVELVCSDIISFKYTRNALKEKLL